MVVSYLDLCLLIRTPLSTFIKGLRVGGEQQCGVRRRGREMESQKFSSESWWEIAVRAWERSARNSLDTGCLFKRCLFALSVCRLKMCRQSKYSVTKRHYAPSVLRLTQGTLSSFCWPYTDLLRNGELIIVLYLIAGKWRVFESFP